MCRTLFHTVYHYYLDSHVPPKKIMFLSSGRPKRKSRPLTLRHAEEKLRRQKSRFITQKRIDEKFWKTFDNFGKVLNSFHFLNKLLFFNF